MRETITGNKALANKLGVTDRTISNWRKRGVLLDATLSDYGKTIIYDLEKVYQCLNHKPVTPGRPAKTLNR